MKTKVCTKCEIEKPLSEFYKDNRASCRYRSDCKKCCKQRDSKRYQKHKELIIEHQKQYYIFNRNSILNKQKKKYDSEKQHLYNQKYYKKNRKRLQKEGKIRSKKYYKLYKKEKIKKAIEYHKFKRTLNIKIKILDSLRNRIYYALIGKVKSLSTMFLIGCEIDYLMYHLQEQFQDGMTWDNYGEWHIDHIRPCASFDLSNSEEQIKCFNYKNLQPLWKQQNIKKGSKV